MEGRAEKDGTLDKPLEPAGRDPGFKKMRDQYRDAEDSINSYDKQLDEIENKSEYDVVGILNEPIRKEKALKEYVRLFGAQDGVAYDDKTRGLKVKKGKPGQVPPSDFDAVSAVVGKKKADAKQSLNDQKWEAMKKKDEAYKYLEKLREEESKESSTDFTAMAPKLDGVRTTTEGNKGDKLDVRSFVFWEDHKSDKPALWLPAVYGVKPDGRDRGFKGFTLHSVDDVVFLYDEIMGELLPEFKKTLKIRRNTQNGAFEMWFHTIEDGAKKWFKVNGVRQQKKGESKKEFRAWVENISGITQHNGKWFKGGKSMVVKEVAVT